jgi:two-component system sensor histidine kinase PilS (NtrC family)
VIIATSVVFRRAACYLVASGASILYGLLVDLEYFNVIQPYYLFDHSNVSFENGYGFYIIFLNIASYFSVAYLSSILSQRLRLVKEELALTNMDLRELQAFHSNVVQDMGNGLITTDLDGLITSANQAAEEILGYDLVDCLGEPGNNILNLAALAELFKQPEKAVLPIELEGWCEKKTGLAIYVRMKISRFSGHGEPVKGYIIVFEDLTQFKKMQEKIAKDEQLAAVGRISAGLAHEIRNPLASVSGSIQVLSKDMQVGSSNKKLMDIVVRETDRLNFILTDFLNYSQPRKNQATLVDLTQTIQDVLTLIRNGIDFSPDIEIQFNEKVDHVLIQCDEKEIHHLIWNLCVNAFHAMPNGGILNLEIQSLPEYKINDYQYLNKGILLTVTDTGKGIEQEKIKNIFDPFFTTKENGVGLGLATVHQSIQRQGGTITVESTLGEGTKFLVFLPAEPLYLKNPNDTILNNS